MPFIHTAAIPAPNHPGYGPAAHPDQKPYDAPQAAWDSYRLTTVEQAVAPMVEATVALLMEQIDRKSASARRVDVPVRLVVRDSVRGLAAGR